jgi:hypothetical protein
VITIKEGEVTARQVEGEFKTQARQTSTWRWYAKKIADKKFQMKFPTAKKVEELSLFTRMEMRIVPGVKFRVDKWNPMWEQKLRLLLHGSKFLGYQLKKELKSKLLVWPLW